MIGVLASQFCLCQWEHNFARQCNRIIANRFRAKWIANSIPRRVATLCPCRFPSHFRRPHCFCRFCRFCDPLHGPGRASRDWNSSVCEVECHFGFLWWWTNFWKAFDGQEMNADVTYTAAPACTSKLSRGFNISSVWCNMRLRQMRYDDNTSKFRASISSLCGCSSSLVTLVSHVSTMGQEDVFGLAEAWETWKQKTADMQRARIRSRSL